MSGIAGSAGPLRGQAREDATAAYTASTVNYLRDACHMASFGAGWWHALGDEAESVPSYRDEVRRGTRFGRALAAEKLALIHSEVSEALEGVRKGLADAHLPQFQSIEVELADALIRIFDLAGAMDLRLGEAFSAKMAYNAARADHKPEARAAAGGKAF